MSMRILSKAKTMFDIFHAKYSDHNGRRAFVLLWFQIALIFLLFATAILITIIDLGTYRIFYVSLVLVLFLFQIIAFKLNISGRYTISATLTVFSLSFGPWVSALLDGNVINGDIVPLVYFALSIQICAFFLSERVTFFFTIAQFIFLSGFIYFNPGLMKANLASLFTFLIFVSIFGILSSFISRKQIDKIADQNIILQENEEKLRSMLVRDPMTGLYNRLYINEIQRNNFFEKRFAVFMFDIDRLKYVNDNFGHLEGDKLIVNVADILKSSFRETDIVARIGGDEFLAIAADCDVQMAEMFKDRVNSSIAAANINSPTPKIDISISVGFSVIKSGDDTIEILIRKADELMYADKAGKRSANK